MKKKVKVAFLDRDGVINSKKINDGYIGKINDFKWIPGAKKTIKYLKLNDFKVVIATNQSGIARGFYSEEDIKRLHNEINSQLKMINCKIHDFFYCPYHPRYGNKKYKKNSYLRKPNPGMILKAVKKWNIDLSKSLMIGDKKIDKIAAKRSNLRFTKKKYNLLREVKKFIK